MRGAWWLGLALVACESRGAGPTPPGPSGVAPARPMGAPGPTAAEPGRPEGASLGSVAVPPPPAAVMPPPHAAAPSATSAGVAPPGGERAAGAGSATGGAACGGVARRCAADGAGVEECRADGRFELAHACRGPGRCRSEGTALVCDMSLARIDDACALDMDGNLACSDDHTMVLVCQGRRFAIDEVCPSAKPCVAADDRFGCGGG